MRVAANRSHVTDLEAPSIRAALELLSEKEPEEQQGVAMRVAPEHALKQDLGTRVPKPPETLQCELRQNMH